MAVLRKKTKAKKAQLEASAAAAEARRAAQESATAVRDLAQALLTQVKDLGLDEKTSDAVKKVKASDAYGKAQARASKAQARAADVSRRVADSDALTVGKESATKTATAAAAGLGSWLATGKRAEALGIGPAKRRGLGWFFALIGVGVGYGIGILTAPKEGREIRDQLASRAQAQRYDGPVGNIDGDAGRIAPSGDPQLADKVRTRLGEDPRTSGLPSLNINVVDGTAVVRGAVPGDADHGAIRDVVGSVDGVRDVDMELGTANR